MMQAMLNGDRTDKEFCDSHHNWNRYLFEPGDPIKQRGSRPGIIRAPAYEPKSGGFTLLRHRQSRAAKAVEDGKAKNGRNLPPVTIGDRNCKRPRQAQEVD